MPDDNDNIMRAPGAEEKPPRKRTYQRHPGDKMRSRHVAKFAADPNDIEQAENQVTLQNDCVTALAWLAADSTRSLIGQEWCDFGYEHNWTRGHRHAVAELLKEELVHRCKETVEQTRARLVSHSQGLYRDARLSGDYGPAVSALRLQADVLLPKESEKQVQINLTQYVVRLPEKAKTVEEWEIEASRVLPHSPTQDI